MDFFLGAMFVLMNVDQIGLGLPFSHPDHSMPEPVSAVGGSIWVTAGGSIGLVVGALGLTALGGVLLAKGAALVSPSLVLMTEWPGDMSSLPNIALQESTELSEIQQPPAQRRRIKPDAKPDAGQKEK